MHRALQKIRRSSQAGWGQHCPDPKQLLVDRIVFVAQDHVIRAQRHRMVEEARLIQPVAGKERVPFGKADVEAPSPIRRLPRRYTAGALRKDRAHVSDSQFEITTRLLESHEILLSPGGVLDEILRALNPNEDNRRAHYHTHGNGDTSRSATRARYYALESPCGQQHREQLEGGLQPMQGKPAGNSDQHKKMAPGLATEIEHQPQAREYEQPPRQRILEIEGCDQSSQCDHQRKHREAAEIE